MGRKKLIEQDGLMDKILELYSKYRNAELVGKELNISGKTIRKYLKETNNLLPRGRRKGITYSTAKRSTVYEWIKKNPKTPIPHSLIDAAKLMGVSNDSLKSYFYRRRKKYETLLHKIGPLNELNFATYDENKNLIPTKAWKDYEIQKISPSGEIVVKATLYNGSMLFCTFRISSLIKNLTENRRSKVEQI